MHISDFFTKLIAMIFWWRNPPVMHPRALRAFEYNSAYLAHTHTFPDKNNRFLVSDDGMVTAQCPLCNGIKEIRFKRYAGLFGMREMCCGINLSKLLCEHDYATMGGGNKDEARSMVEHTLVDSFYKSLGDIDIRRLDSKDVATVVMLLRRNDTVSVKQYINQLR